MRGLWDGLVAVGMLYTLGDTRPDAYVRRTSVYDEPPAGHPEHLRPDLRLTALEQRLAREMDSGPAGRRGRAA
jgi:hypothetical protein